MVVASSPLCPVADRPFPRRTGTPLHPPPGALAPEAASVGAKNALPPTGLPSLSAVTDCFKNFSQTAPLYARRPLSSTERTRLQVYIHPNPVTESSRSIFMRFCITPESALILAIPIEPGSELEFDTVKLRRNALALPCVRIAIRCSCNNQAAVFLENLSQEFLDPPLISYTPLTHCKPLLAHIILRTNADQDHRPTSSP